jgi:hypothetical protein
MIYANSNYVTTYLQLVADDRCPQPQNGEAFSVERFVLYPKARWSFFPTKPRIT